MENHFFCQTTGSQMVGWYTYIVREIGTRQLGILRWAIVAEITRKDSWDQVRVCLNKHLWSRIVWFHKRFQNFLSLLD